MRELAQTGWMHNRARLIVGSFLTKDLHHRLARAARRWFTRQLLDGDPAQNNGNWQWIASVGVDPAPAFRRIYNPSSSASASTRPATTCGAGCPSTARRTTRSRSSTTRWSAAVALERYKLS